MGVNTAPGGPGMQATWTSSAKIGVGTSLHGESNVWFTISHGVLNEIYWPRIDVANVRDMEFIVTDGKDFFSEEKRHADHDYLTLGEGVPAYHIINTCSHKKYRIEKKIITDTRRNVLLQEVQFTPLEGSLDDYRLYLLLTPHIRNRGMENNGHVGDYKGYPMLFAERGGIHLACAASIPFKAMTCGYVGVNDAWTDLNQNKHLTQYYDSAPNGNIALCGEIDLVACKGKVVIALAFGINFHEAGLLARFSLLKPFDSALLDYITMWEFFQKQFEDLSTVDAEGGLLFPLSNAVLKVHEGKHLSGSVIASLSIPWGTYKSDDDLGGYHLIWPRDQVLTASALLAAGDELGARQALIFLMCTQEKEGHWAQCMWADGTPYWPGLQMDETALPIILSDLLYRYDAIGKLDPFPMVLKAASFISKNGPVTQEDRWEEVAGYTPFTIAVEIAALLAAADQFALKEDYESAEYLRETADWWNESIERWLYVKNTQLAQENQIEGYYVRVKPTEDLEDVHIKNPEIMLYNLPHDQNRSHYAEIVSVDALALVRFGLRAPNDPHILNTIKVIDSLLKTDTAKGAIWHRYNRDGYGEHADGSPYNGTGIGRGWPLLTGERAHYELAAGDELSAREHLRSITRFAGVGGLIPEQIWDAHDIPERSLYNGHSTGSAKPLVWAHAEYITLLRSIKEGRIFTMPHQTVQRYLHDKVEANYAIWRFNHKLPYWPAKKRLRIQTEAAGFVRWTSNGWNNFQDVYLKYLPLGIYYADLPVENYSPGSVIEFTFHWEESQHWEGTNYRSECIIM